MAKNVDDKYNWKNVLTHCLIPKLIFLNVLIFWNIETQLKKKIFSKKKYTQYHVTES